MSPIRWSNRARKPKVYWEPPPPTRRRRQPAFTIHADPSEDQPTPEDLGMQSPKDLGTQFPEDLGTQSPEDLGTQSPEDLDTQSAEDQPYQPQFLSKNRAGKPQNLSEDSNPLKLFQLFFTVKEMKNIVKQTNQQTAYTSFNTS